MPNIPKSVLEVSGLNVEGLIRRHQGKVRHSYFLTDHHDKMLVVATDRISIFDFVLPAIVKDKGAMLTAMNHFWTERLLSQVFETDLVACGSGIDIFLPENLRGSIEFQKRATVVNFSNAPDKEDIVRLYLTGSGWTSYQNDGTVCGHVLPAGLIDGSKLPFPIYTPTTKAQVGHDEHVTADSVAEQYGVWRERLSLQAAQIASEYAEKRGIILADTKFEFSCWAHGKFILVDEKLTPDSSRFWDAVAYKSANVKGKLPASFDKQFVREWGKVALVEKDETGRKRDPENPADVAFVHALTVPDDILKKTTQLYRYIFWRLTGMKLEKYQHDVMKIPVREPQLKIEVLVGSESDLKQTEDGLTILRQLGHNVGVNIVSCHRNPAELLIFVRDGIVKRNIDVVIAGAGMAAALPGIVKAHLCAFNRARIPVIGVAFEGKTSKQNEAAMLSIEEIPGQPVELNQHGMAYFGSIGFEQACLAAINNEFLTKDIVKKEARFDLPV